MNARHLFIGGFAVCCGFIAYQEIKCCKDLPWPPRFIAVGLTFTILDMFSIVSESLAGVMAVGFTIAIIVNALNPNPGQGNMILTTTCDHSGVATTADLSNWSDANTIASPQTMLA